MTGQQLGREIRKVDKFSGTKLILATTLSNRGNPEQIAKIGFDAHATKPMRQPMLYAYIAQVCGKQIDIEIPERVPEEIILAPPAPLSEDVRRARLLLAEDSPVNQVLATAMLTKAGYKIDAIGNGRAALEAVQAHPYDMVLMDVSMPEMDGLEASRAIRRLPGDVSRIPIIAMTAHAMEGDREQCFQTGMNDYVAKPVNRQKLLRTVARWLGTGTDEVTTDAQTPTSDMPISLPPTSAAAAVQGDADEGGAATTDHRQTVVPAQSRTHSNVADGRDRPAAALKRTPRDDGDGKSASDNGGRRLHVLDTAVLHQLEMDTNPAVLNDLIKTFIAETVDRLRRMSQSADSVDIKSLEREAHALKSSSGTFGALQLEEQARALELACRGGNATDALGLMKSIHGMALAASKALVGRGSAAPPG